MSKKRPKNEFVVAEADEDSAEESDTEKQQRAAIKKLKSNRPGKFFRYMCFCLKNRVCSGE